ncbi:unnamed protein product, partial [Owenia fusiformis]
DMENLQLQAEYCFVFFKRIEGFTSNMNLVTEDSESIVDGRLSDANIIWLARQILFYQRNQLQPRGSFELHIAFNIGDDLLAQLLELVGASECVLMAGILSLGR